MAVLAGIFGSSQEQSQDSEKLLHLYWNRAELKKEFAALRKEQYRLRDLVKQQEGETARVQQKLEHLETLLVDPEWAGNVLVYYQLRSFGERCERKVATFAEQLKQQRELKQHNRLLVAWNDERTRERRVVDRQILETRNSVMELEDRLQHEKSQMMAMSGFLKIFRRRAVTARLDALREEIATLQRAEQDLAEQAQQIKNRKPPENQGLDVSTKRSINFMILAYAQQLFLHCGDSDFASLVKEAADKSVGAVRYGSKVDCEAMLKRIQKRAEIMDRSGDVAAVLQKRAQLIGENARFRSEDEAVPSATSVAVVYEINANGNVDTRKGNLLGENYWGIARYLSR